MSSTSSAWWLLSSGTSPCNRIVSAPARSSSSGTRRGSDAYFDAHALSDGTLRFISLVTLLLQPHGIFQPDLPTTILLDEPEPGLHPYAVVVLADLLRSAAERTQIIVSTQSVTLVNQLSPEDVIVVDRLGGESIFRHHMQAIFDAFDRHDIACSTPAVVDGGCAGGPTAAPAVVATPADTGAELSWSPVPNAARYKVFRTDGEHGCDFGKAIVGETTASAPPTPAWGRPARASR